jgi:hypothetical protein
VEYLRAFEALGNLTAKAAVAGCQRLRIHTLLIKASITRLGTSRRVDCRLTHSCYDSGAAREPVWALRLVPAPARGLLPGRARGSALLVLGRGDLVLDLLKHAAHFVSDLVLEDADAELPRGNALVACLLETLV